MPTLNPDHPVTKLMDSKDMMMKMLVIAVQKLGGKMEVDAIDIIQLLNMGNGGMPSLICHSNEKTGVLTFYVTDESTARSVLEAEEKGRQ